MCASTLSLATSIPTTTRSSCAIIQLPSLLGTGSKPLQLFGLRKTPDLSHAPRQALWPSSTFGLRSSDGRLVRTARSHILANFADTRARISRQTIARGKPGCLGCTCLIRVLSFTTSAHGAAGAVGARLSLRPLPNRGTTKLQTSGKSCRGNADSHPYCYLKFKSKCSHTVIASEAKQSSFAQPKKAGLLRRCAPRNDGVAGARGH